MPAVIASGIAFPLSFAITQAFGRRERALIALAEMKASAVALYWQHRDWVQDEGFPASLGCNRNPWQVGGVVVCGGLGEGGGHVDVEGGGG
jgi:hypothetical protein